MNDLFGNPIVDRELPFAGPKKRKEVANGYAAAPGSGPKGHFCRDCRFATRVNGGNKHFWKCRMMLPRWTRSISTDIRLKAPACRHWLPKQQKDPNWGRL